MNESPARTCDIRLDSVSDMWVVSCPLCSWFSEFNRSDPLRVFGAAEMHERFFCNEGLVGQG